MQKTLDKIYLPGQDKIIDGLSQFNENDSTNLLQGHEQSMEVTNLLQKDPGAGSMEQNESGGTHPASAAFAGMHV